MSCEASNPRLGAAGILFTAAKAGLLASHEPKELGSLDFPPVKQMKTGTEKDTVPKLVAAHYLGSGTEEDTESTKGPVLGLFCTLPPHVRHCPQDM